MDLSGFRVPLSGESVARPDFRLLTAGLSAAQRASVAAKAAAAAASARTVTGHALVDVLAGGPCRREAVAVQRGSFNPRVAALLRASSTEMTGAFTFAL
ncbi:hypothetical protein [Allosphingosinicella indica]|uniref:Uncharacterized protein n=1 Tax=Allosphingosinicella indica TaxID=941907 RepID=A0A1X7GDP8_9SPHN|nr:hypothetical protein [Allosphingosinicella indica]SMF68280.1 hypothetical protein SAMN06295910_1607 [Allosphingosinicella indica]